MRIRCNHAARGCDLQGVRPQDALPRRGDHSRGGAGLTASDYVAIREANKAEYGNVGRWGRDVLVNRYDSSAHFIFEILQNAEDALKRRNGWNGSREVLFELTPTNLRIVHCGNPFTLKDVKGVCGVGETTKDLTDIGRFGIGFKSVYSITERPEVHSGDEHFAIDSFVFPTEAPPTKRAADQTEFVLPLRTGDAGLRPSVSDSLSKLGARTLLFLRQIEEIAWSVSEGASGLYLKGKAEDAGHGSRRVTLVGQRHGEPVVVETWLVFSREARTEAGTLAGFIEIAFLLQEDEESKEWAIQCVDASPLNAFFPTVVTTHLGFLVQGPYRTTPSRDNVPPRDPWNVKLVQEGTARRNAEKPRSGVTSSTGWPSSVGHRRTLLVDDGPVSRVRCGPVPIHAPTPPLLPN